MGGLIVGFPEAERSAARAGRGIKASTSRQRVQRIKILQRGFLAVMNSSPPSRVSLRASMISSNMNLFDLFRKQKTRRGDWLG